MKAFYKNFPAHINNALMISKYFDKRESLDYLRRSLGLDGIC